MDRLDFSPNKGFLNPWKVVQSSPCLCWGDITRAWNAKRLGTNILFSSQTALYVLKNPRWRKIKRRIFRESTPLSPLFTRKRLWLSFIEHEALYKWFEVDGVSFNHCVTGHWIWKWRAVTQIQLILWNPQYCRCSKWQRVLPCSRSSGM